MSYFDRRILLLFVVLSTGILIAQTQNGQKHEAPTGGLLTRALSAVSGGAPIQDVVQTGKVRRIAGSTDEPGEAEVKAMVSGEARIDLSFPSGPLSEVYARGERGPVGESSGADGKLHAMAPHNLLVDPAWFCPALVLEKAAAEGKIVTVAERTNSGGRPLDHLRVTSPPPSAASQTAPRLPSKFVDAVQQAAQFDLYLDSATFLPVEVDFQTHPDNNIGQDIPVRIRYSDYRIINGVQVPFHVRKFLNGTLYLDLQFEAASFNTGLAANSFVVTAQPSRSLPQ